MSGFGYGIHMMNDELEKGLVSGAPEELPPEKIKPLRDLVHPEVIELEGGDIHVESVEDRVRAEEKLSVEKQKRPFTFYRDLIFSLIGVRLDEARAKNHWKEILQNKQEMSEKLNRNVGIRVAALDYYTNIKHRLEHTVLVDANTFSDTLEQSITDGLTGAYNRRYFDAAINRYFHRAQPGGKTFSLLMLDVDHFKMYNDNSGHVTGDVALIEMVRILNAVTRPEDVVARYGGEEFAVILPSCELPEAQYIAEAVRQSFKDYRFPNEESLPSGNLTVSGGVATYSDETKTPAEMVQQADAALYQAKREGRDRIVCYKEIA